MNCIQLVFVGRAHRRATFSLNVNLVGILFMFELIENLLIISLTYLIFKEQNRKKMIEISRKKTVGDKTFLIKSKMS